MANQWSTSFTLYLFQSWHSHVTMTLCSYVRQNWFFHPARVFTQAELVLKISCGLSRAIISLSGKCAPPILLLPSSNGSFSKFHFHYSWSRWIFQQPLACSQIIIWLLRCFKCRLLNRRRSFTPLQEQGFDLWVLFQVLSAQCVLQFLA